MKDLVSVIMPVYNVEKYVEESIRSVLNQTYDNLEILLIDDCSTDKSYEICKQFSYGYERIKLYKTNAPSGSATVPRNLGIQNSTGRYIAFLDSDDIWLPEKLEKQIQLMARVNTPLSYCGYKRMDELGTKYFNPEIPPDKITYHKLLTFNHIGCSTAIYDSQYFGKVFFPSNQLAFQREDYVMWLSLLKQVRVIHGTQDLLVLYRIRTNSVSSKKLSMLRLNWKIYTKLECLGLLRSAYYISCYSLKWLISR